MATNLNGLRKVASGKTRALLVDLDGAVEVLVGGILDGHELRLMLTGYTHAHNGG